MRGFSEYVQTLRTLVATGLANPANFRASQPLAAALDGQPGRELRRLVSLRERRFAGAFFTGSRLASEIVRDHLSNKQFETVICDPACGAGDLLVAASERLPVVEDLKTTLNLWAANLRGYDIHEEFVVATKLRLVLAAMRRGARSGGRVTVNQLTSLFAGIVRGNGLTADYGDVGAIIMNPPYGSSLAPDGCSWATGSVSEAALFTAELCYKLHPQTRIVAILPDVLRTGTRYAKWRQNIEHWLAVDSVRMVGLFDPWTDVDVFVFSGERLPRNTHGTKATWWVDHGFSHRVSDLFDVHVGPVVPHRDPDSGPWHRFLHARLVPPWKGFDVADAPSRRFDRRTFTPPFVVIRRTSRPDDGHRAIGTIVTGTKSVAVENHLLVALPRARGLDACLELLAVLRQDATDAWLNARIRCRHLTVGAVSEIPWRQP